MILFVTGRCNLRCPHCFYLDEIEAASSDKELRIEEFEKISKSLPRLLQLTCTGGETFVREDIDRIASLFYRNSHTRFLTLTTNGTLPERTARLVEAIARECPLATIRVPLSLDGVDAVHDEVRGRKGTWRDLLKTYELLRGLADRVDNVRIDVTTVLSQLNEDHAERAVDYVRSNLRVENHTVLYARGNVREKEKIVPRELKYRELVTKNFRRRKRKYEFPLVSRAFVKLRETVENVVLEVRATGRLPFACQAGTRLVEMNEYGKLFPCEVLESLIQDKTTLKPPDFDSIWMGDARDFHYDIPKALKSENAKRVRRFIQQGGCACTFECALGASLAFEPRNYFRVAWKNWGKQGAT